MRRRDIQPRRSRVRLIVHDAPLLQTSSAWWVSQSVVLQGSREHKNAFYPKMLYAYYYSGFLEMLKYALSPLPDQADSTRSWERGRIDAPAGQRFAGGIRQQEEIDAPGQVSGRDGSVGTMGAAGGTASAALSERRARSAADRAGVDCGFTLYRQ